MTLTTELPAVPSLEIRLFGGFDVRIDGKPLPSLRSRREQWLLALLVLRQDRDTARVLAGDHPLAGQRRAAGPLLSAQEPLQFATGAGAAKPRACCLLLREPCAWI